jgi:two-component system chemotaxis response regulator CheB
MTVPARVSRPRSATAADPIRVLLVDDSKVARSIFARILEDSDEVEVVAEAADSTEAIDLLKRIQVDVVLLDIEMPKRSGLDALPDILIASNGARIIVVSSFVEENGPAAIEALSLGACDTLAKPGRIGFGGRFTDLLVEKVVRLGRTSRKVELRESPRFETPELRKPACIAIGSSTGGIPVIFKLIQNLDPRLDCPIFIVQHLPDAFMDFFARQLATYTDRPVSIAARGNEVRRGHIYIAPGRAHLVCRHKQGRIIVDHVVEYAESRHCPSVDALFASVADVYGDMALAIVLSGMGRDGVVGARKLFGKGATILVQDAGSSVVWGMPGTVARENLARAILTPDQLCSALYEVAAL